MEQEDEKLIEEINNNPEAVLPTFNPFVYFLHFLAAYGWFAIAASIILLWIYNKSKPILKKWQIQREDAAYHKNPDIVVQRMSAIETARMKQQEQLNLKAKEYQEKEKEKQEKKRQEFIEKNAGKSGHKLGSNIDYFPLMGPGTSGGYRPPKKSKCSGGGCGG